MYFLLVSLIFSLALGPDVRLLRAQKMNTELMSVLQTQQSAIFSTMSPAETASIMHEAITNMESLTTIAEIVEPISEEHTSMPLAELQTTPELPLSSDLQTTPDIFTTPKPLSTAESTVIPVSNTMKTYDPSATPAASPGPTTPEQEESTAITTTESPLITSPPPNIPHQTAKSTKPPETPETVSNEKVETIDTSPTTMPLTTPTDSHTSPEEKSVTDSSPGAISVGSSTEESKKGATWLIISVIALVIFCILITLCIMAIIIKRRRQSGQQNFRHTNGQRFKKKKGTEEDIWAGPVKFGGRDCEGLEEADTQDEKKTDGVEKAGLSTFSTLQENGGVGRTGSPEVEKWEEKEPLLFIDEEGKEKSKETEVKEAEPNGGETFCLTTAV